MKSFPLLQMSENSGLVVCPTCSDPCTHHVAVQSIERFSEDDKKGTSAIIRGHQISLSNDAEKENASSRRGSISIRFTCEHGCDDFIVYFAQHKGYTNINFKILDGLGCTWHDHRNSGDDNA